jgi:hypothetical protein
MTKRPARINLLVDDKLFEILKILRSKYPLLKDPDIIRMAISSFYLKEISYDPFAPIVSNIELPKS